MSSILVFEYLSAGGAAAGGDALSALLPEGLAMRNAIAADLAAGADCDVAVAHGGVAGTVPRGCTPVAVHGAMDLADWLRQQAPRHDAVWAVAPETGGCLAALAQAVGSARWVGCSREAIALASSKRRTVEHLGAAGIATPLAWQGEATHWVVKPDDGAGTEATYRWAGQRPAEADLQRRRRAGEPAWCEPWVEGDAMSLSLLCDRGQAELLSVNRQLIEIDATGAVHFQGVALAVLTAADARWRELAALAARLAAAMPGLHGFVGIDLVLHAERGPVVIEVNPRATSAFVGLSARLGRNVGAEVLALHRRECVDG